MSRVVMTGATSFVGRHCVPLLLEHGHEVHGISRHAGNDPRVTWHRADLLAPGALARVLEEASGTHLLHVAWHADPGTFWTSPKNLAWTRASIELFELFAAGGGERLVAVGSGTEYAWGHGACREDETPLIPATLYGACKHALQQVLAAWAPTVGLSAAWARLFWMYGPHEHPSRLIATVVGKLVRGEPAECGEGLPVRDYLHVEDAAAGLVAILESDVQGSLNVASGEGIALKELMTRAAALTGRPDLLQLGARPSPAGEAPEVVADVTRLKALGWRPRHDIGSGLTDTVAWWREHSHVA